MKKIKFSNKDGFKSEVELSKLYEETKKRKVQDFTSDKNISEEKKEKEQREKGFRLYLNGANRKAPILQNSARSAASERRHEARVNSAPHRSKWQTSSIEVKTCRGEHLRYKAPALLTGRYEEDFDDDDDDSIEEDIIYEDERRDSDEDGDQDKDDHEADDDDYDNDDSNDDEEEEEDDEEEDNKVKIIGIKDERIKLRVEDIPFLRLSIEGSLLKQASKVFHQNNDDDGCVESTIGNNLYRLDQDSNLDHSLCENPNKEDFEKEDTKGSEEKNECLDNSSTITQTKKKNISNKKSEMSFIKKNIEKAKERKYKRKFDINGKEKKEKIIERNDEKQIIKSRKKKMKIPQSNNDLQLVINKISSLDIDSKKELFSYLCKMENSSDQQHLVTIELPISTKNNDSSALNTNKNNNTVKNIENKNKLILKQNSDKRPIIKHNSKSTTQTHQPTVTNVSTHKTCVEVTEDNGEGNDKMMFSVESIPAPTKVENHVFEYKECEGFTNHVIDNDIKCEGKNYRNENEQTKQLICRFNENLKKSNNQNNKKNKDNNNIGNNNKNNKNNNANEDTWTSLKKFNSLQRGRLSLDVEDNLIDDYLRSMEQSCEVSSISEELWENQLKPPPKQAQTLHQSSPKPLSPNLRSPKPPSPKSILIPELPRGSLLILDIISTWGDLYYVGLNGLEVFTAEGQLALVEKIWADPSDLNVLPQHHGDPRIVDNLLDGHYNTSDDHHTWVAPFTPNNHHKVFVKFKKVTTIALLRIWNYNKSRVHRSRGARNVCIYLDGLPIFEGEVASASETEPGETFLFTTDEEILERVAANDNAYMQLLNLETSDYDDVDGIHNDQITNSLLRTSYSFDELKTYHGVGDNI